MCRPVAALNGQRLSRGELRVGLQERIEGDEASCLALTEHANAARKLFAHGVCGLGISADGQTDRSRRCRVRRAVDTAPKTRPQDARHERKLRAAAHNVEPGDISAQLADA